jgi:hypothetical protein
VPDRGGRPGERKEAQMPSFKARDANAEVCSFSFFQLSKKKKKGHEMIANSFIRSKELLEEDAYTGDGMVVAKKVCPILYLFIKLIINVINKKGKEEVVEDTTNPQNKRVVMGDEV